jgi:hypothetical protein
MEDVPLRHTRLLLCLSLIVAALAPMAVFADDSLITIINRSDWDIHHLYLSPVDVDEWGPDQLGEHVIESGDKFQLYGIECDVYDIMIVDEDGDECILEAIDLCDEHAKWVITNDELLNCIAEE